MKKVFLIALVLLSCNKSFSQYDLASYIDQQHYMGAIDVFPSSTVYTLKTKDENSYNLGKTHYKNDSTQSNYYYYLVTPTAKNLELLFKEAKTIIDFYKTKPYAQCSECGSFYRPSYNDINDEEIALIIEGDTPLRYLNLNKNMDYVRLAELGKDDLNFFAVVWCLVPNRLYMQVYMNNAYGNTGMVIYDANGFKAY